MMIKTMIDLNDEKSRKVKSNGWYRITSNYGLMWYFYKNGVQKFEILGTPTSNTASRFTAFVGDMDNETEDIYLGSKSWSNAEKSIEKWIEQHPKGWN